LSNYHYYLYCINNPINNIDFWGLLELYNPDLAGAGAVLIESGVIEASIGVALLATGNPIGTVPLVIGISKGVVGAYLIGSAFGYDPFNIFNIHKADPCAVSQ